MSYYNSSSPRQDHAGAYTPSSTYSSAPTAPRATKPVSSTAYVAANPTYISSPFDDEPLSNTNNHEKNPYDNPYNPDYLPSSYKSSSPSNSYNQSTHEHALSPSFTEKNLATGAAVVGAADAGGQTYAMQHLSNGQNNPYSNNNQEYSNMHNPNNRESYGFHSNNPNYYNGYDEDRASLSNDTAPMRPYADMETSEGLTRQKSGVTRVKYGQEKSKYLPCFPCIRTTCCRFTCCFCLLLLLIIIVLAIVVVTVFKLPKVDYLGMNTEPQFLFNQGNTTLQVSFQANIAVQNPNPIGFNFESIVATAYYPNYAPSIGGGNLSNVDFPSKSNKTIAFPISASYLSSQDPGFTVIKDILTKCGKLGAAATQLTINYDLKLTIKIIGINISPTIKNQHVNFACPDNILDVANNVPGGLGSFIGGAAV